MLQVVPRWSVVVDFGPGNPAPMKFYVHDFHMGNVLRSLATISFEKDPISIKVSQVAMEPQVGVFTGTSYTGSGNAGSIGQTGSPLS